MKRTFGNGSGHFFKKNLERDNKTVIAIIFFIFNKPFFQTKHTHTHTQSKNNNIRHHYIVKTTVGFVALLHGSLILNGCMQMQL